MYIEDIRRKKQSDARLKRLQQSGIDLPPWMCDESERVHSSSKGEKD